MHVYLRVHGHVDVWTYSSTKCRVHGEHVAAVGVAFTVSDQKTEVLSSSYDDDDEETDDVVVEAPKRRIINSGQST